MVWDFCDAFYAKTSVLPNPATIQAFAEKMNLSASTSKAARINWLRFHGYPLQRRGRPVEGVASSSQLDLFYDRD